MAKITEMGLPGKEVWVRRSKDHFTQRSVTFEEYVTSKCGCQVVGWINVPILRGMFGGWENIVLVTLHTPELCSLPIFTTSVNVNSIYSGQQSWSHHDSSLSLSIAILSANTDLRSKYIQYINHFSPSSLLLSWFKPALSLPYCIAKSS